jgi:hypothetical protein
MYYDTLPAIEYNNGLRFLLRGEFINVFKICIEVKIYIRSSVFYDCLHKICEDRFVIKL